MEASSNIIKSYTGVLSTRKEIEVQVVRETLFLEASQQADWNENPHVHGSKCGTFPATSWNNGKASIQRPSLWVAMSLTVQFSWCWSDTVGYMQRTRLPYIGGAPHTFVMKGMICRLSNVALMCWSLRGQSGRIGHFWKARESRWKARTKGWYFNRKRSVWCRQVILDPRCVRITPTFKVPMLGRASASGDADWLAPSGGPHACTSPDSFGDACACVYTRMHGQGGLRSPAEQGFGVQPRLKIPNPDTWSTYSLWISLMCFRKQKKNPIPLSGCKH